MYKVKFAKSQISQLNSEVNQGRGNCHSVYYNSRPKRSFIDLRKVQPASCISTEILGNHMLESEIQADFTCMFPFKAYDVIIS